MIISIFFQISPKDQYFSLILISCPMLFASGTCSLLIPESPTIYGVIFNMEAGFEWSGSLNGLTLRIECNYKEENFLCAWMSKRFFLVRIKFFSMWGRNIKVNSKQTCLKQGRIHGQHQSRTGGQGRKCVFSHFSTRAWWTDQPTDRPTDRPTDGQTKPLIESLVRD